MRNAKSHVALRNTLRSTLRNTGRKASTEAVVVGSGPNGLAAALTLAEQGLHVRVLEAASTIGGGTRSAELTLPGLIHDQCSAFHPLGLASPFMRTRRAELERHGLKWLWPEIQIAHPLDDSRAALLWRELDRTAECLGADGQAWRRTFAWATDSFDGLSEDVLRPLFHRPRHPLGVLRLGASGILPASLLARRWRTEEARALFAGIAAHGFNRFDLPLSSSVGIYLGAAAHAHGWPVAEGGSHAISLAMVSMIESLGGEVITDNHVRRISELGSPSLVMLDTSPSAAMEIVGDDLPERTTRTYRRFRHGPGAFKLDLAINGPIPWSNEMVGRAGTVHLGGTLEEIAVSERMALDGQMSESPFTLVGQQYVADPSRSSGSINPVWAYAHVPAAHEGDVTEVVLDQIERFAPGFRSRIVSTVAQGPADLTSSNPNYIGGDIAGGSSDYRQLLTRPGRIISPYDTGAEGVFLCSASTPPGAGVHGMCGHNAAVAALRSLGI
ncbi:MAG TPA: NAD(P)/FAD-dependent oxidoreductase [Microthrixaceae bacterium]|nr:NAD(P)/FAD-dependent oxidoreductase [Microthrixaceae bacterium]